MQNARTLTLLMLAFLFGCAITSAQSTSKGKRKPAQQQTAARANPEFDQLAQRADEARLAGRLDEAIEHYTNALQLRPKWPDGWWYVGAIFYEKDLYVQARDAFRNLVALDPGKSTAWGMLGLC